MTLFRVMIMFILSLDLWKNLEIVIYGEPKPSTVDAVMFLLFAFISYIAYLEGKRAGSRQMLYDLLHFLKGSSGDKKKN